MIRLYFSLIVCFSLLVFSVLDLCNSYHSVKIFEEHRQYTAFQNVDGQILQWRAMPFGLASALVTFSVLMAYVLQGTIGKFAQNYLDDILIYSDSEEGHLIHIQLILQHLADAELKVSIEKCVWVTEVSFLGHVVLSKGLLPKPSNVDKIINLEPPKDLKGLCSLYGILSYYQKFQANFVTIVEPLTCLMHRNSKFVWSAECQAAFEKLQDALIQPPILCYPLFTQKFTLACDTSLVGAGAVLSQEHEGNLHLIAYASKLFNKAYRVYSASKCELAAVVWAVRHFHVYLQGSTFTLQCDHRALSFLTKSISPNAKLQR